MGGGRTWGDWGFQGTVPGPGGLGERRSLEKRRRVSGEGQGGGLSAGTQSRVTTPSQYQKPRDTRGGLAGGAATPWDPRPSRPAGARAHRAPAGRRRQRTPPSPATKRRWVLWPRPPEPQASTSRPRPLRPPPPERPLPAPTCPLGSEPRAGAPRRWPGARASPQESRPLGTPKRAPSAHAPQGRWPGGPIPWTNSASPALP